MINPNNDNEKKDFQKNDDNLDTKKKRVSYRAKANDFERKKNITKSELTNNKSKSQTGNLKQIKFEELVSGVDTTEKAIAFFLALLETIKWGFIKEEQTNNKNEINIENILFAM